LLSWSNLVQSKNIRKGFLFQHFQNLSNNEEKYPGTGYIIQTIAS